MSVEEGHLRPALQIALIHLFFNLIGALIFYVIPCLRWPLGLARRLSDVTSRYRWFAVGYLALFYILIPLFVLAVTSLGEFAVWALFVITVLTAMFILMVTMLQRHAPWCLPKKMRQWKTMVAKPCRSLEPYDRVAMRIARVLTCGTVKPAPRKPKQGVDNDWSDDDDVSVS